MTQTKTLFLRRETALYSYFPANPPDAFLSLKTADGLRRFFFDVVPKDMPPSAINRRLINYMEFFDDGGWDATNSNLPKFLFLLENPATENRLRRTSSQYVSSFAATDSLSTSRDCSTHYKRRQLLFALLRLAYFLLYFT